MPEKIVNQQELFDLARGRVPQARWIHGVCGIDSYLRCTSCHRITINNIQSLEGDIAEDVFEYCPHCGTKIEKTKDDVGRE